MNISLGQNSKDKLLSVCFQEYIRQHHHQEGTKKKVVKKGQRDHCQGGLELELVNQSRVPF
jgi:hypothetical protein